VSNHTDASIAYQRERTMLYAMRENTDLKTQVGELLAENEALREALNDAENDLLLVKLDLDAAEESERSLEAEIADLETEVKELLLEIDDLNDEIAEAA
jgi:chromosome segregation ATPase